ncbi:MAG: MoaD/ThiS family protein, partial [Allomuricauda sp.]
SLAIAVNNNYATDEESIDSYDEIALIPPVSGG